MKRDLVFSFRDADPDANSPLEQRSHVQSSGWSLLSFKDLKEVHRQMEEFIDLAEGIESGFIKPCLADPTGISMLDAYRESKRERK